MDDTVDDGPGTDERSTNGTTRSKGVLLGPREVLMRRDNDGDTLSQLKATCTSDGDLHLYGSTTSSSYVEYMYGDSDYEYTKTVRRAHIPDLLEALGEDRRADIIEVILGKWCGPEASYDFERRMTESGIPVERWSSD